MERLKILSPWVIYSKKINALFEADPQISIDIDYSAPRVTLFTENGEKAAALAKILPDHVEYGGVVLEINVETPAMPDLAFPNNQVLFETAFSGNAAFAGTFAPAAEDYVWLPVVYVIFKNCVVQFFADNLNDCHGVISTLYQDLATEIFGNGDITGVYFNTDIERGNVGKPLGEWP